MVSPTENVHYTQPYVSELTMAAPERKNAALSCGTFC